MKHSQQPADKICTIILLTKLAECWSLTLSQQELHNKSASKLWIVKILGADPVGPERGLNKSIDWHRRQYIYAVKFMKTVHESRLLLK